MRKTEDGPLVMNTRLSKGEADKVKELHGKTVGYMKEPCSECKDLMTKGILCIGVDESKTDDMRNPYRSGRIVVISEAYLRRIGSNQELNDAIVKKGATFMSDEVIGNILLAQQEYEKNLKEEGE